MSTETRITIAILCIFLWIAILYVNFQHPTKAEVITICEELIKADSNTIFDKKNAGILEDCLLTLIEIEYNEIELEEAKRELENHLYWLVDRNEQRIEELNDKEE